MKWCQDCQSYKDPAEFSKNRRKPDGLDIYCKVCVRARNKKWYNAPGNKEKNMEKNRAWLAANPGKTAEYCKRWLEKNPEKMAGAQHAHYVANKERILNYCRDLRVCFPEKYREKDRAQELKHKTARLAKNVRWGRANRHAVAAHAAKRRASRVQRTPAWLTAEHHAQITEFYLIAKLLTEITGVLQHIDHIVPLRGKTVSGLHVPWNLQVIPAKENLQKHNKWVSS